MRLPELVRPVSSVNFCTRLYFTLIPSSAPRARSNFSPGMTVRRPLVATKVPSRKTFIAPLSSGNSEVLNTLAVRKAVASRLGTVRYSGLAASVTPVIGTFWGELSLGTVAVVAILKEALGAPASIVAAAISASFSFLSTSSLTEGALVVRLCMFIWPPAPASFLAFPSSRWPS